ncbi:MAG: hypothetical protein U9R47_00720 [Actinomycetota bacterium]|nr:hypothetical protein [Actinomycetota bacterium]
MPRRVAVWILTAAWVVALGGVLSFALSDTSTPDDQGFCTMDARLDAPGGWQWSRDPGNDCAWTLYSDSGEAATDDVYQEYGFEPPPAQSARTAAAAWTLRLLIVAIGVSIWFVMTQGRGRPGESPPSDTEGPDGRTPEA